MDAKNYSPPGEMRVVMHNIYEFKKGVRNLVLCTLCRTCADLVAEKLDRQEIEYLMQRVGENKVNLFFGKRDCLDAVGRFIHKPLNLLTPEEDFILGTMLGYDITMQCRRFCDRKTRTDRVVN